MNEKKQKLAIIIPAYKRTFLQETLDSICNQTCQRFAVYIGDDCSPNNLYSIVEEYELKLNLKYKRFENNLGGEDLVSQWERCIDMSQGEEWIWLFSDDDIMEPNCVENFYDMIEIEKTSQLFHYNVKQIDEKGQNIKILPSYPRHLYPKQFLDRKMRGEIYSYVVEFIFNRTLFENNGRFENFDLAWGTDFITWIKLAEANNGITTINNSYVKWRLSSENISPNKSNTIILRKMKSLLGNLVWIRKYIQIRNYKYGLKYYKIYFGEMLRKRDYITVEEGSDLIIYFIDKMRINLIPRLFYIYWRLIK